MGPLSNRLMLGAKPQAYIIAIAGSLMLTCGFARGIPRKFQRLLHRRMRRLQRLGIMPAAVVNDANMRNAQLRRPPELLPSEPSGLPPEKN
jgi:hypothetical protein